MGSPKFGPWKGKCFFFIVLDSTMGIVSQPLSTLPAAELCISCGRYGRVMSLDRVRIIKILHRPVSTHPPAGPITEQDSKLFHKNTDKIISILTQTGTPRSGKR